MKAFHHKVIATFLRNWQKTAILNRSKRQISTIYVVEDTPEDATFDRALPDTYELGEVPDIGTEKITKKKKRAGIISENGLAICKGSQVMLKRKKLRTPKSKRK